jgi:hypothetical protein
MPGRVNKLAKTWTLPVLLLCASCTTVSADFPPTRQCSRYVNPFLEVTAHAAPPASADSKDWVGFAVAEAGQLELSNHDKALARQVLGVCETETQEAHDRAARAVKPWYKRIFN